MWEAHPGTRGVAWLTHLLVTEEIAGSNPVGSASQRTRMEAMEDASLKSFLLGTAHEGYGNAETKIERAEDGANCIYYEDGPWRMADIFYGGHPYSGAMTVYYENQAVWALHYRGWLTSRNEQAGEVYGFLKKALLAAPADSPYRGPKEYREGDLVYLNDWSGEVDNLSGRETIERAGREIYVGRYFGGYVDRK